MASTQLTLAGTASVYQLDRPCSRVLVTILSAPANVYVTADGSAPIIPVMGALNPPGQCVIAGVVGEQAVVSVPLFGDHMVIPTLRFISQGSPVVEVEW